MHQWKRVEDREYCERCGLISAHWSHVRPRPCRDAS